MWAGHFRPGVAAPRLTVQRSPTLAALSPQKAEDDKPKVRRTGKGSASAPGPGAAAAAAGKPSQPAPGSKAAPSAAAAPAPAEGAAPPPRTPSRSLDRIHGGSENLRALLQRRAERQERAAAGAAAAPATAPLAARRRATPLTSVPAEAAPQKRSVRVRFWMPFHVDYGQNIWLVGGCPELGSWVLANGVQLTWSSGDMWQASVDIAGGSVLEYKYVVVGPGGHALHWQTGNNSVLALRGADEEVEVYDNWAGAPGAQVLAAGAAPATRENRLLAWASEIEAQVASQRQELRRARMELVAVQEEARVARDEARRHKAALAESEAQRLAAMARLREADGVNKLLQAQLAETTKSFRHALDTAVGLLGSSPAGSKASSSDKAAKPAAAAAAAAGGPAASTANGAATAAAAAAATEEPSGLKGPKPAVQVVPLSVASSRQV